MIHAAPGSVAATAAYITRTALEDLVTGTKYNFTNYVADVAHTELLLPDAQTVTTGQRCRPQSANTIRKVKIPKEQ